MQMTDWVSKLDGFLTLNDRGILTTAGNVSHELAVEHAGQEFQKFKQQESKEVESDFDRLTKKMTGQTTKQEHSGETQ